MIIKNAAHETTAVKPAQYPEGKLPEVAFAGRSNVGKSSMINALVNRKKLAYVGSTPGKTRVINFYNVNEELRLVDLPGYGYAKVSKSEKHSWGSLAYEYLGMREQLKLIVHLVDIRHKPSGLDKDMSRWLCDSGIPFAVCAVKSDKVAKGSHRKNSVDIIRSLELPSDTPFLIFSASDKSGVDMLWEIINSYLFEENYEIQD